MRESDTALKVGIDHVVLAVPDLDEGSRWIADRGMGSIPGGRHPAHGTHNRLVPLAVGYLELLALDHEEAPRTSWLAHSVRFSNVAEHPLMAVAIACNGITELRSRLECVFPHLPDIEPGFRQTNDGSQISWRIQHLGPLPLPVVQPATVPFFIEWVKGAPAAAIGTGTMHRASITRLELGWSPDLERLLAALPELTVLHMDANAKPGLNAVLFDSGLLLTNDDGPRR